MGVKGRGGSALCPSSLASVPEEGWVDPVNWPLVIKVSLKATAG